MIDWMKAINAHVHNKFVKEQKLEGRDFWDDGPVQLALWKVPPATQGISRRLVGIRSLPRVDGPRTGEGLFPGEVVEVIQVVEDVGENQRYLRLADDRGWIFESHPTVSYIPCVYIMYVDASRCTACCIS